MILCRYLLLHLLTNIFILRASAIRLCVFLMKGVEWRWSATFNVQVFYYLWHRVGLHYAIRAADLCDIL